MRICVVIASVLIAFPTHFFMDLFHLYPLRDCSSSVQKYDPHFCQGATWEDFKQSLTPLAQKFRGRVAFVSGHDFLHHARKLHLSGNQYVDNSLSLSYFLPVLGLSVFPKQKSVAS
jgi:hypothetical protein